MELIEEKTGAVMTVALKGRLDGTTADSTEKKILELIHAGERFFVLDLEQLDYISSAGLRVFVVVAKRLKTAKGDVILCSLQSPIKQVLDIAGFGNLFRYSASRQDAINDVSDGTE